MLLGEPLFLLYTRNHLFRHLIELPLQLPDFIPPGDRNSLRIVALGKFCRGTHKTVNASYYVTRGQHAKERAKRKQEEQPGRCAPGPISHKRPEVVNWYPRGHLDIDRSNRLLRLVQDRFHGRNNMNWRSVIYHASSSTRQGAGNEICLFWQQVSNRC